MIKIILILAIFAVLWFTKKIWGTWIVKFFRGGLKRNITIQNNEKTTIFAPTGTTRSFVIALDITENGDGSVGFAIAKLKQKEV
jgi:hypothetical protein